MSTTEKIDDYNRKIAEIDEKILNELEERMDIARDAAICRSEMGLPLDNPIQERKKLKEIK